MKARMIFDADGHVFEDPAGMSKFMPEVYRRWKDSHGVFRNAQWFAPFSPLHTPTGMHPPGGFGAGKFVGPDGWAEFLDETGIAVSVLYPTVGLTYGFTPNVDYAIAVTRAYNDWLHEAYLRQSPRFKGMGLIPMQEPEAAAEELCRIVEELGMCGAMLPSNGLKAPLGSKEYWPVYKQADRLGCALAVHGGNHVGLGMDKVNVFAVIHAIGHPLGMMINLGSLVFNGIFDRFPNTRFAFLESGAAWLLFCLERFDGSYKNLLPLEHRGELVRFGEGETPSGYILKLIKSGRIFLGCEGDELMVPQAIKMLGNGPFIYSSDFPHEVSAATCNHHIAEVLESSALTQEDKDALLYRNAERFYRVKVAA